MLNNFLTEEGRIPIRPPVACPDAFGAPESFCRRHLILSASARFSVINVKNSDRADPTAAALVKLGKALGEIVASIKSEGRSKRTGLLLEGAGGGESGVFSGVELGSSDFRETVLGQATEAAVKDGRDTAQCLMRRDT